MERDLSLQFLTLLQSNAWIGDLYLCSACSRPRSSISVAPLCVLLLRRDQWVDYKSYGVSGPRQGKKKSSHVLALLL